jgi:phosphatidylglycerophosphatase A
VGYFPIAPGTAGSVAGVFLDQALRATLTSVIHGLVIVLVSVVGVWVASIVEKESSKKDPSLVVVDEVAGMLLSLYLIPLSWIGILVGFLVFRLLDIVKPFPCRRAEKIPGGVGIVADDLIAGVYTNIILRLASLVWPALLLNMNP